MHGRVCMDVNMQVQCRFVCLYVLVAYMYLLQFILKICLITK